MVDTAPPAIRDIDQMVGLDAIWWERRSTLLGSIPSLHLGIALFNSEPSQERSREECHGALKV